MAKIKEVSSYNGTSWDTPVPIGANDANIDITSSTTNPSDTTSTSAGLVDSNVTVAAGDTDASAWTKFNRFRKRVQNAFGNFAGITLRTAYNTSNTSTSVYTTGVINNYMSNVIGYTGTTAPSAGTVAAQLSSLNSNKISTNKIANNLTTTTSGYVLDARQGQVLQDSFSTLNYTERITDFDTATTAGAYYYTANTSNAPSQGAGRMMVIKSPSSISGWGAQLAFSNSNSPSMALRSITSSGFGSWIDIPQALTTLTTTVNNKQDALSITSHTLSITDSSKIAVSSMTCYTYGKVCVISLNGVTFTSTIADLGLISGVPQPYGQASACVMAGTNATNSSKIYLHTAYIPDKTSSIKFRVDDNYSISHYITIIYLTR